MPPPRIQTFDLSAVPEKLRPAIEQAMVKPLKLFMEESVRSIAKAWVQGDNLAIYEDIRVDVPSDWVTPTFLNGWDDYGDADDPRVGYRKTEQGDLELRGRTTQSGAVVPSVMFMVPFLPEGNARFV